MRSKASTRDPGNRRVMTLLRGRGKPAARFSIPRGENGLTWDWKATQVPPWKRRATNRAANKVARASRKGNR